MSVAYFLPAVLDAGVCKPAASAFLSSLVAYRLIQVACERSGHLGRTVHGASDCVPLDSVRLPDLFVVVLGTRFRRRAHRQPALPQPTGSRQYSCSRNTATTAHW